VKPRPAKAPAAELATAPVAPAVPVAKARPAEQPNKVVPMPQRPLPPRKAPPRPEGAVVPAARPAAGKSKKSFVKISAILAIAAPTALATLYYGLIASPQYVAEARFAVRGPEEAGGSSGDVMGALTGMGGATGTSSDSFILAQYIESARLVENLQRSVDLRAIFTNENADFLARYRPYDFDDTIEHLTAHWNSVSSVYYEPVSSIITFSVRAFTPEDALKIAREAVRESEQLVNRLSERAREDAIMVAKQEQARAELRLKVARKAIQDYRDREGVLDPTKSGDSQLAIVADLEGQLAKQEAELATATAFLSKDAPTVRVMRNKADALRSRISAERAKIGTTSTNKDPRLLSASLAEFENLSTDREFAEKAYQSAVSSLETARIRAERQSRYLATFVEPRLPQDSLYPARIQSILLVLVCSALAWAIGVLIFYGIRDHSA
jgi:capsular polysaccharide transport system permease protein